jgi:hypothetical protein
MPEEWGHAAADGWVGEGVARRETGVCRFDDATGVGVSYLWRRRLLQRTSASATKGVALASATCGSGSCYNRRERLLQRASASATCGGGGCYNRRWRRMLQSTAAADATSAAADATKGAAVCYKGRRQLLLVAVADATIDGKGAANLYKRRRQLLQTPVAVATNRASSCCKETGEACAVLPGRRRSLKPRMVVLPE